MFKHMLPRQGIEVRFAEDDSVKVSPTPGETVQWRIFPVRIDGEEIIRFTDTPGFQLPRQTLKWMNAYGAAEQMRITTVSWSDRA